MIMRLCLLFTVLALSACAEKVSTVDIVADGSSKLNMSPPAFLNARAVVPENLVLDVTINREPVTMVKTGETWQGETQVQINSDVALEVRWSELFNSNTLPLAVARETVESIDNNYSFQVVDTSYIVSGDEFDADSDAINNITERRQNTDPYDATSPGTDNGIEPMVKIPASGRFNIIDGQYNDAYWNNAQFEDANGDTLYTNNLIVDEPTNTVTGEPNMQWAAIHDEEFLTIFVFGKTINPAGDPAVLGVLDSGTEWFNEDTLELFWDGDLSQLSDYDTVDDMHILIPLLRNSGGALLGNKSGEPDTTIKRGANVQPVVEFDVRNVEFANCLCQGFRSTWEIRINLAEAQIPIGKTFGFEIQINRDDDGDRRESKWAWALDERSPGDTNVDSDLTWRFPSTMGTMKLLPFP